MCFGLASAIIKKMVLIILTNDVAPNIWPLEGRMFPPSNEQEEEEEEQGEEEQGEEDLEFSMGWVGASTKLRHFPKKKHFLFVYFLLPL